MQVIKPLKYCILCKFALCSFFFSRKISPYVETLYINARMLLKTNIVDTDQVAHNYIGFFGE